MDPIKLLTPDPNRVEPFLSKYWVPSIGCFIGVVGVCIGNFAIRRPIMSGIQKHAAAAISGWFLGSYADTHRNEYLAERDAVFRHYVQLHPEDFPAPERKKFKDVLETWYPVR